jgi:hypothetical protein
VQSDNTAANQKGRAILWWALASFVWLVSIPLCLLLAHDLVSAPPPSLQTWVVVAEWLPLFAVSSAAVFATITLLRRGAPIVVWINAAKGLLWCSVLIVLIAIPKAP